MNTSEQFELPTDFECPADIADSSCGARNNNITETGSNVVCLVCDAVLGGLFEKTEEDGMQFAEGDESDDDDGDFQDEVTVAEGEVTVTSTPEQQAEKYAMEGLDIIKDPARISKDAEVKAFGEWVHERRFQIRDIYVVLRFRDFFSTGITKPKRMMIITVMYATYKEPFNIEKKVFDFLNMPEQGIRRMADRAYEDYTGDTQSRMLMHIRSYGKRLGIGQEVITAAVEYWDSADPVYVPVDEQVRAVVWLMLMNQKLTGKKFNKAETARNTPFDARTLSKVAKKYEVYFE